MPNIEINYSFEPAYNLPMHISSVYLVSISSSSQY